jgi:hypothetical protein
VHKIRLTAFRSHPVPVARAAQLRQWIESGAYGRILAGDYPRRDDDADTSMAEDVKAAADSYREAFQRSQDPLVSLLRRLGDGATDVGGWVGGGVARARTWASSAGEAAARAAGARTRRSEQRPTEDADESE